VTGWVLGLLACGPSTPEAWLAQGREQLEAGEEAAAATSLTEACRSGAVDGCSLRWPLPVGPVDDVRFAMERACEVDDAAACTARSETPGDHWDRAACDAGSGAACLRTARAAADEPTRQRLLATACHAGEVAGCLPAADAARATHDHARAAALLDQRCALGGPDDVACPLAQAARRHLAAQRACEAGEADACRASCAAGHRPHCEAAADSLRAACDEGDGVACRLLAATVPDDQVPLVLWKGCDEVEQVDPWSCLFLADAVEAGAELPAAARGDVPWLRNQGCDLQLDIACAHLDGW